MGGIQKYDFVYGMRNAAESCGDPSGSICAGAEQVSGAPFCDDAFVITMYFGGGMVPTYMLVKSLHLTNSPLIMIVMGAVSVYNVIITRTF